MDKFALEVVIPQYFHKIMHTTNNKFKDKIENQSCAENCGYVPSYSKISFTYQHAPDYCYALR